MTDSRLAPLTLGLLLSLLLFPVSVRAVEKPNVILIYADDMGWGDVGYHGVDDILTPNIDRLAAGGVHFTQGYVSASVCGPSRCGLMTGVYQQRLGCGENPNTKGFPENPLFPFAGLPTTQPILPELLQPLGYRCGMVGKWHLGLHETMRPHARGFDNFYGFLNGSHDYEKAFPRFGKNKGLWPLFRNGEMLPAYEGYLTDTFSDEAVAFIRRNKQQPFFLYVAYNAVHHPWQVPERYRQRTKNVSDSEDRRFFAAMVLAMDDGVGRIMTALDASGVSENTLVFFISDNGTPRGQGLDHAPKDLQKQRGGCTMSSAGPFRGYKGDTFEGGIRVPFVMHWPGKIKPGTRYDHPVTNLDVVPTVLAPLGIKQPPQGFSFDGVDLMPYLDGSKGDERPHDVLYWRRDDDYAIRKGDWKLAWNDTSCPPGSDAMLFHLARDPGEYRDLSAEHPDVKQRLQDLFDAWDSRLPPSRCWGGPKNRKSNPDAVPDDRPNMVLIMADDLGAECIGAYGCRAYKTPVLDKLAAEGIRFENCHAQPLCTPSRVKIMTGRYAFRNYTGFGKFDTSEVTFGKVLQDAGYRTCMVGKWQLGGDHTTPTNIGFDEYCLQNAIRPAEQFDPRSRGRERYWGYPLIVANGRLYESEQRYGPDMMSEYAVDFIKRANDDGSPFFLYYPMILPHSPFAPTPRSSDGDKSGGRVSELKYFKDMVEYVDLLVGRVLQALDESGQRQNTIIMFTGDNGTTYPVNVTAPSAAGYPKVVGIHGARHASQLPPGAKPTPRDGLWEGPLTRTDHGEVPGGKDLMSERGTHVPLIVDWPRYRAAYRNFGNRCEDLIDFSDFFTTVADLAETGVPQDRVIDGVSFASRLSGEAASKREYIFCHYWSFGRKKAAARESIRDARWKLYDDGRCYDLQSDLEERRPLTEFNTEAAQAKRRLERVFEQLRSKP